jgi:hypothetical protein
MFLMNTNLDVSLLLLDHFLDLFCLFFPHSILDVTSNFSEIIFKEKSLFGNFLVKVKITRGSVSAD